jgi:hypothetical protein
VENAMNLLNSKMLRSLRLACAALFVASMMTACGGGGDEGGDPFGTIEGTAAVGAPMRFATVKLSCRSGASVVQTDGNGHYRVTFRFSGPCLIVATSGSLTVYSFASGPGSYNVTPLSTLLMQYMAGQLHTTFVGLLNGFLTNTTYQSAFTNTTVIQQAQVAIVRIIKVRYNITLSSTSFLTFVFTPGTPGLDSDLDTLQNDNAWGPDGDPIQDLSDEATTEGGLVPIGGSTGGTGTSGGTGSPCGCTV